MEPKYKAWDKIGKKMFPVASITFACSLNAGGCCYDPYGQLYSFNEIELLEFSGLKDKHGKELYFDSDIVKLLDSNTLIDGSIAIARRDNYGIPYYDCLDGIKFCFEDKYNFEIIGTIQENPELLNEM